jgi:hypothetical protein
VLNDGHLLDVITVVLVTCALFVWRHQPTVLFSQNKPAITNQPAVLFSQNKPAPAISHQPNEQADGMNTLPFVSTSVDSQFRFSEEIW